ncbi:MAG TPA: sulfatase [Bacteroidales bacterium]|nr:sulfatase [Bacteroidales bacterium]
MKHIPAFFLALVLVSCNQKVSEQPNIVFIMSDDHGYQAISAYDGSLNSTPALDRLADEGVIFRNSFVCNSICAPSRAALLTGKHSQANGHLDNRHRFDSSQVTFPKLLQAAGYQTALIGKWHLQSQPMGFDYWNILPGQGLYYNPDFIEMGKRYREKGYTTTLITDMAIEWISNRDKSKPFCILVHHKAPHRNWLPDTLDFDLFDGTRFPVPDNYFDDYSGRQAASLQEMSIARDMRLSSDLKIKGADGDSVTQIEKDYLASLRNRMSPREYKAWNKEYDSISREFLANRPVGDSLALWKLNRYLTDYLRTIQSIDRNTGRLIDFIDSTGLRDNTLIVYTSDQGFYLGEHGWFDKRFMYEESFRTPLLMRLPKGYSASGDIDQMVQNIDLAPTFLEMAGVKPPKEIQGISLLPLLKGKKVRKWRDAIYYHYYEYPGEHQVRRHYGIRTDRYKLIHFYGDIDQWELYDLVTDPHEMKNLINDAAYISVTKDMKSRLDKLRRLYKETEEE